MPIAKVQLPDGRIARFEVDEGVTPEQVEAFASQNLDKLAAPATTQQPTAAPERGIMDDVGDYLNKTKAQLLGDGRPFKDQMADIPAMSADDPRFLETNRKALDTGLATLIPGQPEGAALWKVLTDGALKKAPMGVLDSAARRIGFGSAVGASHGDTVDEKIAGGIQGGLFSGAAEAVPAMQAIGTMGKRALIDPTFNPEKVVGATLRRMAEDPTNPRVLDATIEALKNAKPLVRGSDPTAPQASGNAGLWGLYKATMAREPSADRAVQDAQNLARLKAFKELGVGENAGRQADELQSAALGRLGAATRQADDAGLTVDLSAVEQRIDDLLASPSAIDPVIASKLKTIKAGLYDMDGNLRQKFQEAHAVKSKGINRMIYGENGLKIAGPSGAELEGLTGSLSGEIDDAINASLQSPLYNDFRSGFAKGKLVESRNKALADLLKKGSSPGMLPVVGEVEPGIYGATGEMQPADILSAKLLNATKTKQWDRQKDVLTPKQTARIDAIKEDIARNIPRDVKRGSDTYQNMAIDYLTSDILGAPGAGNTLFGGLTSGLTRLTGNALTKIPGVKEIAGAVPSANALENPKLRELMVRALTDPQLAAQLMEAYRPASLLYTTLPARVGPSVYEQFGGP